MLAALKGCWSGSSCPVLRHTVRTTEAVSVTESADVDMRDWTITVLKSKTDAASATDPGAP